MSGSKPASLLALLLAACALTPPPGSSPLACPTISASQTMHVDTTVYDSTAVDTRPRRLAGPPPEYPAALRQNGVDGRVVVEFTIGADGRVEIGSVHVLEFSDPAFVSGTIEAIRASIFCPAIRHGTAVRYHVNREPVVYRIAGRGSA